MIGEIGLRNKNRIFYLGSFPPPYGGVTVKNEYLFQELQKYMGTDIEKLDTSAIKRKPILLCTSLARFLTHLKDRWIVGTAAKYRRRITMFLRRFHPKVLNKSILMVMGGNFAQTICEDTAYISALQKYRCIYVETHGMEAQLHSLGITNTSIYPNCRKRPECLLEPRPNADGQLKCVFFSQVSIEKGVDIVLDAARRLKNVSFDIWGGVHICLPNTHTECRLSTD